MERLEIPISPPQQSISSTDGTPVAVNTWVHSKSKAASPSGRAGSRHLVVVHGACEHQGRYLKFAETCHEHGWNVTTFDFRGHGRSAGPRVDIASVDEYIHDLKSVLENIGATPQSVSLMAHSMGGLVVMRALQTGAIQVNRVVFSSPLVELAIQVPTWKLTLGRLLLYIAPRTRFKNNISAEQLTHDPNSIQARRKDPDLQNSVTASWFFATQKARRKLLAETTQFPVPVLMLQAAQDVIVSPKASRHFFDKYCSSNPRSRFVSIESAYHEVLNETTRDETIDLLLNWLDETE